ncbi:hypothetical protein H2248_008414 [Termitomyces sp. 'cryptogamus']|nr:hypothetical protein H2248_008414 [Termitomyces sp. 'cryptogamus']
MSPQVSSCREVEINKSSHSAARGHFKVEKRVSNLRRRFNKPCRARILFIAKAVTGKQILFGYDLRGRPGLYLFPSRQNTDGPERQIQFTVWMLERTIDLMGPGVETLALLINYGDKAKNPSLSVARTVLNILQDHYPERLGAALILNVPFLLNAFYKLINPFIDPVSRDKMKFNPRVIEDKLFTGDMVMSEWWGGDCDFEYVHDKYWPTLVSICESRRKVWLEKWRTLGGTVGLKEWEYKSGKTISVAANKEKVVDQPEQLDVLSCVDPMAV